MKSTSNFSFACFFLLFISLMFAISCSSDKSTSFEPEKYTIEQFFENVRVSGGSFSPDGSKILVSSNESGIFNAMELPVDGSPGRTLTSSKDEYILAISYTPDGQGFLYTSDQGGNEINHIFLFKEGEKSKDLTPGANEKADFFGWKKDQTAFYYLSNGRDPSFFDLMKMDMSTHQASVIFKNTEGLFPSAISDDERFLALTRPVTTSSNEMILIDLQNGERKEWKYDENNPVSYSPQFFSNDNADFYFLTDEGSEFQYLAKYPLATMETEVEFKTDWDVWYAYDSWNGKYRIIGINEDGKTTVKLFRNETGDELEFPSLDGKSVSGVSISKDEKMMRITATSSRTPSDLFVHNFETGETRRLTNTLNAAIREDQLVEGTVVRYPSFDGLEIPAIYYKPHQASSKNKVPALVWVHGGPGGQSRLNFDELIQFLVNHGYAVLAVNNRGSSGYGKTFFKMDDKKHGEVDLQDCVYGKNFLQTLDYIDPDKIGIIGGSYGGYMTMAALTFTPEEFEVGVNIFGVTNWLRTLKSIPPWWAAARKALYDELGDPFSADSVRLHRISPLFHTENVVKPLMVLQGANDPRVLQVESDEIVEGVRANGVPVEYVLFEDEGHGFLKKENQIAGYGKILKFLDQYLKGEVALTD